MHQVSTKNALNFVFQMVRPFSGQLIIMVCVAIIWAIDISLGPYILKKILNCLAEHPSDIVTEYLLYPVLSLLLLIFLTNTAYRVYDYYILVKMIPCLRQKIVNYLFSSLLQQSQGYYQNNYSGSLSNKINDLATNVPNLVRVLIDRFFSYSLALFFVIYTLWMVSYKFALVLLIWIVTLLIFIFVLSKKIHHFSDKYSESYSILTGKIVDILSNILSVRQFARSSLEKKEINDILDKSVDTEQKLEWAFFLMWVIYGNSFFFVQAFSLYFLIIGWQQGVISIGDFALVLSINITVAQFLWHLAKEVSEFSKYLGKIIQGLRITMTPFEVTDSPFAKPLIVKRGTIIYETVHFKYHKAKPLFNGLSIKIRPGERVGLVGYTGSGKSTFVNLLLRLFDVTSGQIRIDGQNIREVTQKSLHESISIIPQDPSLFHRTLMDNIRYGRIEATEEEVIYAAKAAHAHNFITNLPEGYNTLVGERGIKLSGGQRQRIAIARAILKNAPILILDEATNQLDSITESYVQDGLEKLMQSKTTIVIAHRLSTLLNMDRILVFDNGKIIEDGSHELLIENKGTYFALWNEQINVISSKTKFNTI